MDQPINQINQPMTSLTSGDHHGHHGHHGRGGHGGHGGQGESRIFGEWFSSKTAEYAAPESCSYKRRRNT